MRGTLLLESIQIEHREKHPQMEYGNLVCLWSHRSYQGRRLRLWSMLETCVWENATCMKVNIMRNTKLSFKMSLKMSRHLYGCPIEHPHISQTIGKVAPKYCHVSIFRCHVSLFQSPCQMTCQGTCHRRLIRHMTNHGRVTDEKTSKLASDSHGAHVAATLRPLRTPLTHILWDVWWKSCDL